MIRRSLLAALALAACAGEGRLEDPPDATPADATVALDRPAAPDAPAPDAAPAPDVSPDAAPTLPPFAPAPATLQRLTRRQYQNALRDLLGASIRVPADLEVDTPLYGFTTLGAASLSIAPRAAEQYEAAALDVARQTFADAARRAAFVGCAPAAPDDACVTAFLQRFGRRAWRRPLADAELDRWRAVVSAVTPLFRDVWAGLEYAVAGMLASPGFLYRVELGGPDPADASRLRYTGYEMASRLSFTLWTTTPDDALLDAAARGELDTAAGVRAQAARLLADARAREAVGDFFGEYLKLDRLEGLSRDPTVFPLLTPTLGRSMRAEVLRLLDDVVFGRDADVREMFDTRVTFVNDELARLYNLPGVTGAALARVELPAAGPRAGVLTTAGFLTLNAHATVTSPTLRGRFIRQFLLCEDINPPPEGVQAALPLEPPDAPRRTLRQRLEALHLTEPTCASCHVRMDPLGFGLENFDALGLYRTTDNGLPVDPRGEVDGRPFRNARELGRLLREHPHVAECLVRQTYRYASGHLDTDGEARSLAAVTEAFAGDGHRFRAMLAALVSSDGFRYAGRAP